MDLIHPQPDQICIEDVAWALSRICRYAGHTNFHYSVAEHSVRVMDLSPSSMKRWALLHDAAEAYLNDVPRPVKMLPEMKPYRDIEENLQRVIMERFEAMPHLKPNTVADLVEDMRLSYNVDRCLPVIENFHVRGRGIIPPLNGEGKLDDLMRQIEDRQAREMWRWGWPAEKAREIYRQRAEELGIR